MAARPRAGRTIAGPHVEPFVLEELHLRDPRLNLAWNHDLEMWAVCYQGRVTGKNRRLFNWPADEMDRRLLVTLDACDTDKTKAGREAFLDELEQSNEQLVADARQSAWNNIDHDRAKHALGKDFKGEYGYTPGLQIAIPHKIVPVKKSAASGVKKILTATR